MTLNKKIDAFTLSEMLVVLVISSIVISMAFLGLLLVQKQLKSIQDNLDNQQQMQFTERLLWRDFNSYSVRYLPAEDILFFKNSTDSLSYIFDENFIIRNNDTLEIPIIEKQLFLDGLEVQSGVIDAIKIETYPIYRNKKLFIYKTKDASFYLNN